MKLFKMTALLTALTALAAPSAMAEGGATFTYCDPSAQLVGWGTSKNEVYNIAIFVNDPSMVGKKIVGMTVNAPYSENITDIKAFLTKELAIGKPEGATVKQNMPDICEVKAVDNHGTYSATFAEPYTLTSDGVYVGYTFTVTAQDAVTRTPVACTAGTNVDGLYVYTSRTYMQWKSRSEQTQLISSIKVEFEGEFEANSLGVTVNNEAVLMAGNSIELPVTLYNHGTDAISSIDYTISIDGVEYSGKKEFSPALKLTYGSTYETTLTYGAPATPGTKDVVATITKVNGEDNNDSMRSQKVQMGMLSFVPVKRPVMEEYTGLGCGYCPRGFAAMEYMNEKYGAKTENPRFIALAYHNYSGDPMMTVPSASLPNTVSGYPGCFLDREQNLDPYYGSPKNGTLGIEGDWLLLSKQFTPIDVIVTAEWNKSNPYQIDVVAKTKLARQINSTVKLAFALLGDRMHDPDWYQSNYFSGNDPANFIPQMEKFCKGLKVVDGLEFDDVVLMSSNLRGENTTLQGILPVDEFITDTYTFNVQNAISQTTGKNLALPLMDDERNDGIYRFRVAVLAIDRNSNRILNANTAFVTGLGTGTNVDFISSAEVENVTYYDLSGCQVANPAQGMYIRVTKFADGKRVSEKVMMK